jgi:hypothetical protein
MDDFMELLEEGESSSHKPAEIKNTNNNYSNNRETKDTFDYWGDPEVKPEKIDIESFKDTKSKSFTIVTFVPDKGKLPEEIASEFYQIAKVLAAKGYTFRHTGDSSDDLQNKILDIENIKTESYLPWKKFNLDINAPYIKKPTPKAYKIAASCHVRFSKMSNGVRCILARNVNAILGNDCNDPVDFILAYSEDGAEGIVKGLDYKITGSVAFYLKVAEDSNISVFNLKNNDIKTRLVEHIKK